jgi:hypothetical protein
MYYLAEYILRIKYSNPITLEPLLSIAKEWLSSIKQEWLPSVTSEWSPAFAHERLILLHRRAATDHYTRAAAIHYKRAAAAPQEFVVATAMYYLTPFSRMTHLEWGEYACRITIVNSDPSTGRHSDSNGWVTSIAN